MTRRTPQEQRDAALQANRITRTTAILAGWASKPSTFPERSRCPTPSPKGSCRAKRAAKRGGV